MRRCIFRRCPFGKFPLLSEILAARPRARVLRSGYSFPRDPLLGNTSCAREVCVLLYSLESLKA